MKKAEKQFDLKRRLCLISALSFTILYILSALVLGESMKAEGWIGAAVVIGAMMISELSAKKETP